MSAMRKPEPQPTSLVAPKPGRLQAVPEHMESARVLVIELGRLGEEGQRLAEFVREQQTAFLAAAAVHGKVLVVMIAHDALEFYSTDADAVHAFRPIMVALWTFIEREPGLGRIPTVELSGELAEEHLLLRASGLRSRLNGDLSACEAIHSAAALSAACAVLGPTLGSLFWCAANVSRRVLEETKFASSDASPACRALDGLEAERIVAEESAALSLRRAQIRVAARQSLAPEPESADHFTSEECESLIRLRISPPLPNTRVSYR